MAARPLANGHIEEDVKLAARDEGAPHHCATEHSGNSFDTDSNPRGSNAYVDCRSSFASTRSTNCKADIFQEQKDTVRAALKGELGCDDAMLGRFIRATGGNLPLTIKRLLHTLKWRREFKPASAVCPACTKNPKSHYMHVSAFDKLRRPTIYSCLALAHNRNIHDSYTHLVQQFELSIGLMSPGVDSWVWICDFQGFGLVDCDPRMAKIFLSMSSEHYPERLGLFLILGAPMMFNVLWKAISPFIDPKTFHKIRFLPMDYQPSKPTKPSLVKAELTLHYEPETVDWLLAEMVENRDKKKAASKIYDVPAMYAQAMAGTLVPCAGHDSRGTNDIIGALSRQPHLIQPQGTARP